MSVPRNRTKLIDLSLARGDHDREELQHLHFCLFLFSVPGKLRLICTWGTKRSPRRGSAQGRAWARRRRFGSACRAAGFPAG